MMRETAHIMLQIVNKAVVHIGTQARRLRDYCVNSDTLRDTKGLNQCGQIINNSY